jgi:hypothetical protein
MMPAMIRKTEIRRAPLAFAKEEPEDPAASRSRHLPIARGVGAERG